MLSSTLVDKEKGLVDPGGFEQEDMNNFIQCMQSRKTSNGKKIAMNLQLGLGVNRLLRTYRVKSPIARQK